MLNKKKITVAILTAAMAMGVMTGCGSDSKDTDKTVATVGDQKITYQEANFQARYMQLQYESQFYAMYGDQLWEQKMPSESDTSAESTAEGTTEDSSQTLEAMVKQNSLDQLETLKVTLAHADEYKVSLTDAEKKEIKEQVPDALKSLPENFVKETGIDEAFLQKYFEDNQLFNKTYEAAVKDSDTTVKEADVRQAKIDYVLVAADANMKAAEKKAAKAKANKLAAAVKAGKDFEKSAKKLKLTSSEITMGSDYAYLDAAVVKAAMALKKDEISPVIEAADGYYILKCVARQDKAATAQAKNNAESNKKNEAFQEICDKWIKETPLKITDQKLWDAITFKDKLMITTEAPAESTTAAEGTTKAPETTTAAEGTTAAETTTATEGTTAAPETTTAK